MRGAAQARLGALLLGVVLTAAGCSEGAPAVAQAGAVAAKPAPVPARASETPAAPPRLSIECPVSQTSDNGFREIGYDIEAVQPYTVSIDYGDGKTYSNDHSRLAAIFEHDYSVPGAYQVVATLTDAAGQITSSTCAHTWVLPPPADIDPDDVPWIVPEADVYEPDIPEDVGPSYEDYCAYDEYVNVDGDCVERPDDHSDGATAQCSDGTYSYSRNRRGTCSYHGGVAQWY